MSLSSDAFSAATHKCEELGLDQNKGDIPLAESFINLDSAVKILCDAIENKKLIQLPLTIQRELFGIIEAISEKLIRLNSGSDEIINLVNEIELLNASIWKFGLHNLSDEVLGYATKMNQLKAEEVELIKLKDELSKGLLLKDQISLLIEEAKQLQIKSSESNKEIEEAAKKAEENLKQVISNNQNSATLVSSTQQNESNSIQLAANAKSSAAEVQALEKKIKEFFSDIDSFRKKIDDASLKAATTISENESKISDLIIKLSDLEDQIKDKIEKATGFSLFHSFQTRQGKITTAKHFWGGTLAFVIFVSLSLTAYIAHTTSDINIGFYLKLSMSIPLIYAISFCTIQYSRERRLEEEYAFKSAISISLDPYQSLVSRLIDKTQPDEIKRFTEFILDAIQKVFTSPTEKIFQPEKQAGPFSEKNLKKVAEIVGSLAKASRP